MLSTLCSRLRALECVLSHCSLKLRSLVSSQIGFSTPCNRLCTLCSQVCALKLAFVLSIYSRFCAFDSCALNTGLKTPYSHLCALVSVLSIVLTTQSLYLCLTAASSPSAVLLSATLLATSCSLSRVLALPTGSSRSLSPHPPCAAAAVGARPAPQISQQRTST